MVSVVQVSGRVRGCCGITCTPHFHCTFSCSSLVNTLLEANAKVLVLHWVLSIVLISPFKGSINHAQHHICSFLQI